MFEVGKVVMKIAGRDAGMTGVIVEVIDEHFVLIDGEVRRRKCNIKHIEPLAQVVKIKKGASHDEVLKALGLEKVKKAGKAKAEKKARPKTVRAMKPVKEAAPKKKAPVKKAAAPAKKAPKAAKK